MNAADLKYLQQAIVLAWAGLGRNSPNPLVGCVLVKDGHIVAKGAHIYENKDHAEIVALKQAGESARGATIYINLEPCCHHGRTPPCTDAIIAAGITRVVYGIQDPFDKVSGQGAKILSDAGLRVEKCDDPGMIEEIEEQNRFYLHHKRHAIPYVTCKAASSLDGRIATRDGESQWITGPDARAVAHLLRGTYDAVAVGARTVAADDPKLTYRPVETTEARMPSSIFPHTPTGLTNPVRVVIDPDLRLPPNFHVFDTRLARTIVICSEDAYPEAAELLVEQGVEIIRVPKLGSALDLYSGLLEIAGKGIQSLLIEGGGETFAHFLNAGLINELNIFYAPLLIGGRDAIPLISGEGPSHLTDATTISHMKSEWVGADLLITGRLKI